MKVMYLRLENVAGIKVGQNKDILEIDFKNSNNVITSISGKNGNGKSVLISTINPFSGVTSLDERSTLPFIIPGKNGYKEIHYQDGKDYYVIKHYYKATKDSHSIKSYFAKNGEELNENGNVTSFNDLVEMHFGLTQEMMRLIRLGTNVNSFITLTPAKRKEYIGKLIEEIDLYLKIYKKINDDIRVVKVMLTSNSTNLYNCHISDIVVEEENLNRMKNTIKSLEKERDSIISEISKLQQLIANNDINELKHKKQEAEISLKDLLSMESEINKFSLQNVSIDQLMKRRNNENDRKIDIQSKINSYRLSIDNTLQTIERLEISIKKITSNNDIESLSNAITDLQNMIKETPKSVIDFSPSCKSDDLVSIISKLGSFNQIASMVYTFGNKPLKVFLKLKAEEKSIDKFLSDQQKRIANRINENDVKIIFDKVFGSDDIITPNCDNEFEHCPYYRLSEMISGIKDKLEEETFDEETLRYIQVISNNFDNILNEIDQIIQIPLPGRLLELLKEKSMLNRMENNLPFFDISQFHEYLTYVKEHEIYIQNLERLKQLESQLLMYKKSGIDANVQEIKTLRSNINFYEKNIGTLLTEIDDVNRSLKVIDEQIGLVSKYTESKKYKKVFESTIESTDKILAPLETANNERIDCEYKLRNITDQINLARDSARQLENKINEYKRLTEEGVKLSKRLDDLNIILESVSTKKGIPVIYMKQYLGKIQKLSNDLLSIIYEDELRLSKFKVTQDTFEVPYVKNGMKVMDVKYASQSEIALITMALSFALANRASGKYNILLLDEIDAGLDETNRNAFLKMLHRQMETLKCEQVFIISHNLSQMVNVPMDCIKLSDDIPTTKLQNVIYE